MENLEIVGKKEVANRQISEAISLFFEERDIVAIHTLISAAHQILVDLGKEKGIESAMKNRGEMSEKEARNHFKSMNFPFNFFKHADNDSSEQINIAPLPRLTQDFLMDAVWMLQAVTNELTFEAKVYWQWFVSKYPEEFDNLPKDGPIAKMQENKLASLTHSEIAYYLAMNKQLEDDT